MTCWDCGADAEVVWPSDSVVRGVERLLMMRPDVITRNWTPGESLHDLLAENVSHGIWTGDVGDQLAIVADEIIRDTLPARQFQPAIGGR